MLQHKIIILSWLAIVMLNKCWDCPLFAGVCAGRLIVYWYVKKQCLDMYLWYTIISCTVVHLHYSESPLYSFLVVVKCLKWQVSWLNADNVVQMSRVFLPIDVCIVSDVLKLCSKQCWTHLHCDVSFDCNKPQFDWCCDMLVSAALVMSCYSASESN